MLHEVGMDISVCDPDTAKRRYRRYSLILHPDRYARARVSPLACGSVWTPSDASPYFASLQNWFRAVLSTASSSEDILSNILVQIETNSQARLAQLHREHKVRLREIQRQHRNEIPPLAAHEQLSTIKWTKTEMRVVDFFLRSDPYPASAADVARLCNCSPRLVRSVWSKSTHIGKWLFKKKGRCWVAGEVGA